MSGLGTCGRNSWLVARPRMGVIARRFGAGGLLVFVCALVLLGSVPGPASGAVGHGFVGSFEEAPVGSSLVEPGAMAVDGVTGEVFVGDSGAGVVDVFGASGAFVGQIGDGLLLATGIAVDEASGLVFVADEYSNTVLVLKANGAGGFSEVAVWSGRGLPGGSFGEVGGVAVDNSNGASAGDVYVVDRDDPETGYGAVYVFKAKSGSEEDAEGALVRVLASGRMEEPNGVAVDAKSGRVYVADSVKGSVFMYGMGGEFEGKLTGSSAPEGSFRGKEDMPGNVSAVAVDPVSGDLLVAESERRVVSEFDGAGDWVGWIRATPAGLLGEPGGVAVGQSGTVYVADAGLRLVDEFGAGATVPDVSTGKASAVTRTGATLNGIVDGDGMPASYGFEWGADESLGSSTTSTASGGGEEAVTATLTGLKPSTTYYFRLKASDGNGENEGLIHTFTTPTAVEGVNTGTATGVEEEGATLTGSLSPKGIDAHYFFEYGQTNSYGTSSPVPPGTDAGAGKGAVAAATVLSGLAPNTTYHYRIVATNELGKTVGEDRALTTSGPPRITVEPVTGLTHEAATLNAKVDPDQFTTNYRFEYGETTAYGHETPVGGADVGAGEAPVAVSVALGGLKIGFTYHYRVVAASGAGTTVGSDQTFTTVPPALIDSTSVARVGANEATLEAKIDPLGNPTTYYFQYGTQTCEANPASCVDVPSAPQSVGEDSVDHGEEDAITGLQPATTYHYRVIATNVLGTNEGPERTFTTRASASQFALPDGRAWEMVTPPNKQGAPIESLTREGGLILASEDGDRLTYVANGALGEEVQGNRTPEWQQVLATRAATEWTSRDIATPNSEPTGTDAGSAPEYQFFDPDLSTALVEPYGAEPTPPLAPGVTQGTMYLRDNLTGAYLPLLDGEDVAPGTQFGGRVHFIEATPDLGRAILSSSVALLGSSSAAGLYEWSEGKLEMASLLPDGQPAKGPIGAITLGYSNTIANALSSDGTRVVWTTPEEEPYFGHLYLRDTALGQTVQLDAAQGLPEPTGRGTARFEDASSDGSRVLFTDRQRLTPDATAEAHPVEPDLYECDMVAEAGKLTCKLTDLTVDHDAGQHANVQALLLGTSDDATTSFLVATGVLASNLNGNGERAVAGRRNLYEIHYDGGAAVRTFIGTLASEDSPEWEGNDLSDTAYLTARVSPNGRFLAFMSAASLTGYDNTDQLSGQRDEEVFLYDTGSASLRCVSCNPTGERPTGVLDIVESGEGLGLLVDRRKIWVGHWLAGNIPGWTAQNLTSALLQSRYLSNEGRLYFNSPDGLVPGATDGKENVYEYEPSGDGSCESVTGACVSLISSGTSDKESAFVEATPDGSDVFFVTEQQLLPQDTDTEFDIYDARECTETAPCLTPPRKAPPGCGSTPDCRPAQSEQPIEGGATSTATFTGPGNTTVATTTVPSAKGESKAKKASKPLTRSQKLSIALKSCKKRFSRSPKKRGVCERSAHKRYGPTRYKAGKASGRKGRGR
jgi:DNA-binding beta-propeller fold protein YncE